MTLHEWTHSEATLKQLAPSVYRQLEANIIKAEQRKSEAWQRIQQRIGNSATQKGRY